MWRYNHSWAYVDRVLALAAAYAAGAYPLSSTTASDPSLVLAVPRSPAVRPEPPSSSARPTGGAAVGPGAIPAAPGPPTARADGATKPDTHVPDSDSYPGAHVDAHAGAHAVGMQYGDTDAQRDTNPDETATPTPDATAHLRRPAPPTPTPTAPSPTPPPTVDSTDPQRRRRRRRRPQPDHAGNPDRDERDADLNRDCHAMIGRLHHVVIDCPDPTALAGFYSELLGLPVTFTSADWVVISRDDTSSGIAFQLAPDQEPPRWPDRDYPQQFHLDVMVDDVDAAEPLVLALGARRLPSDDGLARVRGPGGSPVLHHPASGLGRPDPTDEPVAHD